MPDAVDLLAAARKKNGMTQEQLGKKLGVPKQTVSKWENRKRKLTIDEALTVAKIVGVSANQLYDTQPHDPQSKRKETA